MSRAWRCRVLYYPWNGCTCHQGSRLRLPALCLCPFFKKEMVFANIDKRYQYGCVEIIVLPAVDTWVFRQICLKYINMFRFHYQNSGIGFFPDQSSEPSSFFAGAGSLKRLSFLFMTSSSDSDWSPYISWFWNTIVHFKGFPGKVSTNILENSSRQNP